MKPLILLACSLTLASAGSITFTTSTICTSLTTVTDPDSCSISDWLSTETASIDPSSGTATLATGAGANGPWQSEGEAIASLSAVIPDYYTFSVSGMAMGEDAASTITFELGTESWSAQDYGALQFTAEADPGEMLFASVVTAWEGYANLNIAYAPAASPVPEPGAGALVLLGLFALLGCTGTTFAKTRMARQRR